MAIINRENRLVRLENVYIAYPHLWEPHGAYDDSKKSFSCEVLFDIGNPQHQQQMNEIVQICRELLTSMNKSPDLATRFMPLKDGNLKNQERVAEGKESRPELENRWYMRTSDPNRPPIVYDQNTLPMGEDQSANLFGGCVVHVVCDFYWRKQQQNPGISAGLKIVQLVNNVGVERWGGTSLSDEMARSYLQGAPAPTSPAPTNPGPQPMPPANPAGPAHPQPWDQPAPTPGKPDWF